MHPPAQHAQAFEQSIIEYAEAIADPLGEKVRAGPPFPHYQKLASARKRRLLSECHWQPTGLGLLKRSHRPREDVCALRSLVRERRRIAGDRSRCVQHMQKALAQMNPELDSVLSDIGGKTGLRIIRAICAGERDGARLAKLRDWRAEADEGGEPAAAPGGEGEKPGWERQMREAMRRAFGVDLAALPSIFSAAGPDFSMLPGESRFCQRPGLAAGRAPAAAVRGPPAVPPSQAAGVRRARQGWRYYPIGTDACADLKDLPESFSFCKDFSGGKRALVEVFIIRLHGRALSERLMRPAGVAEALEFGRLDVQGADAELATAGGVGALDAAVILGAFGRQREQRDAALPAAV